MKALIIQTIIDEIKSEWGINIVSIGRRYGYHADENSTWYYVSTKEIAAARGYFAEEYMPYSQWCAACKDREVPSRALKKHGLA